MELFSITVQHNGKEHSIEGKMLELGYTHKIYLEINGVEIVLEPDEERNYRAVVDPAFAGKLDKELVAAVVSEMENHLK